MATDDTLQCQVAQLTCELKLSLQRCEQFEKAYSQLLFQFKQLQRSLFGRRSERYEDPDDPQGLLFESAEARDEGSLEENDADGDKDQDDVVSIAAYKRHKKTKKPFAEHLPRKEVVIPVSEQDKTCACGCQKNLVDYERHERLNYIPPVYEVIVELREKVACPKGCAGQIVIAPKPKHILPKGKFTESVLAHLIASKLDDRQPFYHLEKQFETRAGFSFPRQTMARTVIDCATPLQPLINLLKDGVIGYDIGALDATSLQVLNEPGRPASRKSYAYCFRGGPPGKEAILYEYNASDQKNFVNDWFAGFKGTLHCDADPFFELLFEQTAVNPNHCNAHARRKFEPIARAAQEDGLAKRAMQFYKKLYRVERKAKENQLTAKQRHNLRQEESKPIMTAFKCWLDEHQPQVLPKSPLGKAMNYCLKYWSGLCAFLNDGRLEIDNNLTEQEIKPFVMARKNFLFASSVNGAKALCLHFSLIRTAKHHGLDPYRYYVEVLKQIPHCQSVEDYEALLPWNIQLERVGLVAAA
ncbi:IS66 family transposase [uncultured Microbulbifer sp.]|uniref:IS66 family transposase n=1 Tax=uncultured Microbulbifer sp. TaxID=348147 RepID=UPI00261A6BA2|nr:IS66 family transposase [uncultured Microbulbifer sp.]